MTLNLQQIVAITDQFKDPHPARIKVCSTVNAYLREQFKVPSAEFSPMVPSTMMGCPIYINEEIPPDQIVFYDQFDAVYDVLMIPEGLLPDVIAAGVRAQETPT